jgi:peptidoglycan-N-acetylglucosamine deacetylase
VRVALTFDAEHPDHPRCTAGVQDGVLELLAERGIRASFFLQGRWVEAYPDIARRIVRDGHLVGSHSFYHARMPLLSERGLRTDVTEAQRAIVELAGAEPRPWFRFPWGDGWDQPKLIDALAGLGYRHVGWDVVAYDWEPDRSPEVLEEAVVKGVAGRNGETVVLLHTWPEQTLAALSGIISALQASGATFVRVDELVRVPTEGEF